jgi:hypothetical protein
VIVEHRNYRSLGVPGGAMSASAHEALVRRAIEVIWNRGDLDAADELFAAGYVNHYGLIADLVLGPEAIKVSAALYRVAFPGLHVSVEEISTIEDTVVLRWTARTAPGGMGRTDASQAKSLSGVTRSRFAGGKIVESWTEWDRIGVLRELGVPTE